jgi:hypothetical protein
VIDSILNNMPQLVSLSSLYDVKNCKSGRFRALIRGGRKPLVAYPAEALSRALGAA